jgi:hypothetical protein
MSDNLPPVDSDDKETVTASGELLANEVRFASAFVTPFAAAVAVELEEFGLSKQKIDEIMLRSAKRFGAMNCEEPRGLGHETDRDDKTADYLGWFKSAGGQAYDFLASVVVKHGPDLIDKLAPIVTDALQQALSNYVKGATGSNGGTKSKPTQKSRR